MIANLAEGVRESVVFEWRFPMDSPHTGRDSNDQRGFVSWRHRVTLHIMKVTLAVSMVVCKQFSSGISGSSAKHTVSITRRDPWPAGATLSIGIQSKNIRQWEQGVIRLYHSLFPRSQRMCKRLSGAFENGRSPRMGSRCIASYTKFLAECNHPPQPTHPTPTPTPTSKPLFFIWH